MKTTLAIALGTAFLLAAGTALAQEAKASASSHNDHATQSVSPRNAGSQMIQMDEHMKKMQALHQQVANATTPEERQSAMNAQQKEMQACMGMMGEMQGGGMMGNIGGGTIAQKSKPSDQNTQMQMMQKRMDMMQMMMQTMMDQQGMMGPPKDSK